MAWRRRARSVARRPASWIRACLRPAGVFGRKSLEGQVRVRRQFEHDSVEVPSESGCQTADRVHSEPMGDLSLDAPMVSHVTTGHHESDSAGLGEDGTNAVLEDRGSIVVRRMSLHSPESPTPGPPLGSTTLEAARTPRQARVLLAIYRDTHRAEDRRVQRFPQARRRSASIPVTVIGSASSTARRRDSESRRTPKDASSS